MNEAYLEVDFQGWIADFAHDQTVVETARTERAAALRRGALVISSRYLSRDPEDPQRSDPRTRGASWVPGLEPPARSLVLTKYGRDLADNPDLEANLRSHGVERVSVAGIATEHGVRLVAESLLQMGMAVSVRARACAGETEAAHLAALDAMAAAGIEIVW